MKVFPILLLVILTAVACKKNNPQKVIKPRTFNMGFSTTNFGTEESDQDQTYDTIQKYGDIYLEEITSSIPWEVLISNSPLPPYLLEEIETKVSKKNGAKLVLGLNLLNKSRTHLQTDFNGNIPAVNLISNQIIEDAYYKYVSFMIYRFKPDYVILSIGSNELLLNNKTLWPQYKVLMANVRERIKAEFPELKFSQSISLHNWEKANVTDMAAYNAEIKGFINGYDFAAISYFPYFNDQHDRKAFQKSFDFLTKHVEIPVAIVKTGHLANNLEGSTVGDTESDEDEQEEYLNTLLINAHNNKYEFVIWSVHQDYDLYWENLPDWDQASAKRFRDIGLKNENGTDRKAFSTWKEILAN